MRLAELHVRVKPSRLNELGSGSVCGFASSAIRVQHTAHDQWHLLFTRETDNVVCPRTWPGLSRTLR
jgi:hypothetical protein